MPPLLCCYTYLPLFLFLLLSSWLKFFCADSTSTFSFDTRANVRYNISYGENSCEESCPSCQCLDLYLPPFSSSATTQNQSITTTTTDNSTVVLFLHGGLWYSGSRDEIAEVCQALAANHNVSCATADYHYSQDLGGCCQTNSSINCTETFSLQAKEVISALMTTSVITGVPIHRIILGGHSAGGHLSVLLAMAWDSFAPQSVKPPRAFVGVEGIYNASLWDFYDSVHWQNKFECQTRQTFGESNTSQSWLEGSPVWLAKQQGTISAGPMLLIHSPQDDWVQTLQTKQMFDALHSPVNKLDLDGRCVGGQHPDVLTGQSAVKLAKCIVNFASANVVTTASD